MKPRAAASRLRLSKVDICISQLKKKNPNLSLKLNSPEAGMCVYK